MTRDGAKVFFTTAAPARPPTTPTPAPTSTCGRRTARRADPASPRATATATPTTCNASWTQRLRRRAARPGTARPDRQQGDRAHPGMDDLLAEAAATSTSTRPSCSTRPRRRSRTSATSTSTATARSSSSRPSTRAPQIDRMQISPDGDARGLPHRLEADRLRQRRLRARCTPTTPTPARSAAPPATRRGQPPDARRRRRARAAASWPTTAATFFATKDALVPRDTNGDDHRRLRVRRRPAAADQRRPRRA